jgi:2-oxoisovalerate ferredoxin oxidoreductase beta subunit
MVEEMEREFPLGCFRDRSAEAETLPCAVPLYDSEAVDALFLGEGGAAETPAEDASFTPKRLKVAGFGGQGVLSLGMMLALAGQRAGRAVTWFPSYGPEQRGGTANCSVVISDREIGSPVVSTTDVLIALNKPSLDRFAGDVRPGGTIFYDAGAGEYVPPQGIRALAAPAFDLAAGKGVARAANTAMLGVVAASGVCALPQAAFDGVVMEVFGSKPDLLAKNREVFAAGSAWGREHIRSGS